MLFWKIDSEVVKFQEFYKYWQKTFQNARNEQTSKNAVSLITGFGQAGLMHCWGTTLKSLVQNYQEFAGCISPKNWHNLARDPLS